MSDESLIQKQLQGFGHLAVASPDTVQVQEPGKALMTLSAAIRIGAAALEDRQDYCGCVVGCAFYAKTGRMLSARYNAEDPVTTVARLFAIPASVVDEAENRHMGVRGHRRQSREYIASWLESQGY